METKDKSGKLLFTIKEVFSNNGYLNEKNKSYYNIPLYQRGYKWEPHNVKKLLTDVDNFQVGDGKFYCLQNITIVEAGDYFNVIDGQQRLTTLSIIISFLNEKSLVTGKVRFPDNSIRKFTNTFLHEVVTNVDASFPQGSWEQFVRDNPQCDLQDIGHIFNVHMAVEEWVREKERSTVGFDREKYLKKLLNEVRLIVNEVDGQTSEEKVFGNLNSKRIPLDGSDLIRAMLITRVAKEEGRKELDLKTIVYINERRVKLGWEMDQINNWWGEYNVKGYFSNFISISSEYVGADKKLFNEEFYPINNLYLLYAEAKGEAKLTLDLIEQHTNSAIVLYKEILRIHHTLQDWYSDKLIYHFLGFLFNVRGRKVTFREVWSMWETSSTRDEFYLKLKSKIRTYFLDEDECLLDYCDLSINWYEDQQPELIMTLILMDVIHSLKDNQPKLPHNRFWKSSDDIEHIFPRNPKEVSDKKAYVEFLNKYKRNKQDHFDTSNFSVMKHDPTYIERLDQHIEDTISNFAINSVGNLVLLYRKLNQSISNSIYSVKRSRIIEHHSSGAFIQPHTFKVFTRDFNDDNKQNLDYEYWTNEDIKRNCAYITREINNFFQDCI